MTPNNSAFLDKSQASRATIMDWQSVDEINPLCLPHHKFNSLFFCSVRYSISVLGLSVKSSIASLYLILPLCYLSLRTQKQCLPTARAL